MPASRNPIHFTPKSKADHKIEIKELRISGEGIKRETKNLLKNEKVKYSLFL
jgi:hypothetical protein